MVKSVYETYCPGVQPIKLKCSLHCLETSVDPHCGQIQRAEAIASPPPCYWNLTPNHYLCVCVCSDLKYRYLIIHDLQIDIKCVFMCVCVCVPVCWAWIDMPVFESRYVLKTVPSILIKITKKWSLISPLTVQNYYFLCAQYYKSCCLKKYILSISSFLQKPSFPIKVKCGYFLLWPLIFQDTVFVPLPW